MPVASGVVRRDLPLLAVGFLAGLALVLGLRMVEPTADAAILPSTQTAPDSDCQGAPPEELAAQVLIAGLPGVLAPNHPLVADLVDLQIGGVLVEKSNVRNAAQVRRLVSAMRDGIDVPLLVTTDEEPGRVSNFGEVLGRFSAARTLAKRGTPHDVEIFAEQLGVELANLGMDVVFGPVADVDDGPPQGLIGDRSFSGDPEIASEYALAFTRGLWAGGVLPAPKHFPGAGRATVTGSDEPPRLSVDARELRAHDLGPFRAQIRAGVRMVMLGNVVYDVFGGGLPASLSPPAYGLLRGLGFHGVAVTAPLDEPAVAAGRDLGEAAVQAIWAGADAVLLTDGGKARMVRDALVRAVSQGRLEQWRLAEAAGRMVALKGLDAREMTCPSALEVA